MSTSACHLGYFFAILKTQVSEKLGPPLPSVSSHRIGFPVVHFTQFVIYRMALDDDSTQRTRTVRECCGSGWGGDDSMQFRAVQAMFCTKLGAPCSSLQKAAHLKPRVTSKEAAWAAQRTVLQNSRVDVSTGSGRNMGNQCLLALLLCEKCSLGAVRCDAMQTVCRGLTNAVRSVLQVALFALRWTGSC